MVVTVGHHRSAPLLLPKEISRGIVTILQCGAVGIGDFAQPTQGVVSIGCLVAQGVGQGGEIAQGVVGQLLIRVPGVGVRYHVTDHSLPNSLKNNIETKQNKCAKNIVGYRMVHPFVAHCLLSFPNTFISVSILSIALIFFKTSKYLLSFAYPTSSTE